MVRRPCGERRADERWAGGGRVRSALQPSPSPSPPLIASPPLINSVIDSQNILQAREDGGPEGLLAEAFQQIAFSDTILLNKVDMVSEEDLADRNFEVGWKGEMGGVGRGWRAVVVGIS
jgi:hypothetical protein